MGLDQISVNAMASKKLYMEPGIFDIFLFPHGHLVKHVQFVVGDDQTSGVYHTPPGPNITHTIHCLYYSIFY